MKLFFYDHPMPDWVNSLYDIPGDRDKLSHAIKLIEKELTVLKENKQFSQYHQILDELDLSRVHFKIQICIAIIAHYHNITHWHFEHFYRKVKKSLIESGRDWFKWLKPIVGKIQLDFLTQLGIILEEEIELVPKEKNNRKKKKSKSNIYRENKKTSFKKASNSKPRKLSEEAKIKIRKKNCIKRLKKKYPLFLHELMIREFIEKEWDITEEDLKYAEA